MNQTSRPDPFDERSDAVSEPEAVSVLRAYADRLVAEVDPVRASAAAHQAVQAIPVAGAWRRRVTAVLTAMATFFGANVGLAFAANPAAPGDLLYPLDLTYEIVLEAVGVPLDTTAERLEEAAVLVQRDDVPRALEAVEKAMQRLEEKDVDAPGLDVAKAAVSAAREAAEERRSTGIDRSDPIEVDLRAETAALITYVKDVVVATAHDKDREPGAVAEVARQLKEKAEKVKEKAKEKGGSEGPGGPPITPPGKADD